MKKVYIPTMDELYEMQDMTDGQSIYKYILIKAIESLVIDGVNYPNKGILKSAYKYLKENPDIAYAICRMYPSEIKYSEYAQNDINLCLGLINKGKVKETNLKDLDNLHYFENGIGIFSSNGVVQATAHILAKDLPYQPQYRFEYKQNSLLDDIFARKIYIEQLNPYSRQDFIEIEPAYILTTNPNSVIPSSNDKNIALYHSINKYANRYGIDLDTGIEYYKEDILTNQDEQVKRLFRCLKEHNK